MANTKKYVSLDKLGLYDEKIKKVISDGDAASLQSAKEYADSLAVNYDVAGAAATVQGKLDEEVNRAKGEEARIEALITTAQGEVDALELVVDTKAAKTDLDALAGKVGEVPEGSTVMGIITNIQENAYDDTALRGEIEASLALKADKTQVATDIAAAVKVETDARVEAVQGVQGEVDALEELHAKDKKDLEDAIALKADQTALDDVSAVANAAVAKADYDVKVKALEDEDARIAGLVSAEAERAAGVEAGLQEQITANANAIEVLTEGIDADKVDGVKDLIAYVDEHGAEVTGMKEDIEANAKAISDHAALDHDFAAADTALENKLNAEIAKKATIETVNGIDGRLVTVEGKVATLEGDMEQAKKDIDAVEAAVATKAETQALADAVSTLEGVDAGLAERIGKLEAKHGDGEGTVESLVATAKQEAIDAAAEDATTKADAAEAAAKTHADGLNTAMNTRMEAVEAKAHEHANKALLDTYTQTEADLADAVSKKHAHENMSVLEAITAAKVAAWDAAEQAAKTYADGLNTNMDTRVSALELWHENFLECSEEDVNKLFQ